MYTISQSQNINGRHLKEFLPWPMQARKFHFYKGRNFYVFLWKIFRGSSILLNWKKTFFIKGMPGLFFLFFLLFTFFYSEVPIFLMQNLKTLIRRRPLGLCCLSMSLLWDVRDT